MGGAESFKASDFGLKPGLLHQARVAGRDRLGHRELVRLALPDVLEPAQRGAMKRALALTWEKEPTR